ncbi:ClpXP adapter SpxH family protein [Emticicia agri]|uniref:DsbA family protein n=1 Tax=Emticicia agri TaxID=2492393 RepID=A0A4Q5LVY1_9BACT|nr:ClpXP adapter SpxH family protein [Emticicia agri]RYU93834.1 DsbA family protein [Emticicia agri]
MTTNNNPLLCDPESGICEIPGTKNTAEKQTVAAQHKPVKIIYFTDPICSSCWGIEPQLRKLKLEYGAEVEIEYHMGGLLPDWSYNSGGISKPSDVAHHWDEVSLHYQMPIDGDVWLEDPLDSSYPPSIAFKAAQLQDEKKAIVFLRSMREMVFLQKKNITKWEVLAQAATKAGLDTQKLEQDYNGVAKELFQADLNLARQMGVRGFPSVFVTNRAGNSEFIYGTKPYTVYENGISKIYPAVAKTTYQKDWESLFHKYPTLTLREFSELAEVSSQKANEILENLAVNQKLKKFTTKNGAIWIKE